MTTTNQYHTAAALIKALGGKGTHDGVVRCPAHDDRSPSLSISERNGKVLVRCHGGCSQDAVISKLKSMGLWPDRKNSRDSPHLNRTFSDAFTSRPYRPLSPRPPVEENHAALKVWNEAQPLPDTPAYLYLQRRGINTDLLPVEVSEALRFHPACPWEQDRRPCMVALYRDVLTNAPRAIHRTLIPATHDEKVQRKMWGPTAGCVVKIWPDYDVLFGLVIGEGIETVLSAATVIPHHGGHLQPAWAATSAGLLGSLPVMNRIETLTILADKDFWDSGHHRHGGQAAAVTCAQRWQSENRKVYFIVPKKKGQDFNDLVRQTHE